MSEENVKVVRKAIDYEYYGVGDRAEAEAIFDPQVVLNPIDEGPSSGFDAMRSDMERWASAFDELTVTVEEIIDAGDQVVVITHHEGRGREAGSRSIHASTRSIRCATARSRGWMSTSSATKPSKPPGCWSSTAHSRSRQSGHAFKAAKTASARPLSGCRRRGPGLVGLSFVAGADPCLGLAAQLREERPPDDPLFRR
jgi:ketosteroid isomerase-like protein